MSLGQHLSKTLRMSIELLQALHVSAIENFSIKIRLAFKQTIDMTDALALPAGILCKVGR